jgi:hypothetical protein
VRRRLALLPVLAALPFLSGCLWWGYGAGVGSSDEGTATLVSPDYTDADAAVLVFIPAIEAYYADNQTYAGATPELLRKRYDPSLPDAVRIVVRGGGSGYCVEAPSQAPSAHFEGPAGPPAAGPCPSP